MEEPHYKGLSANRLSENSYKDDRIEGGQRIFVTKGWSKVKVCLKYEPSLS